MSTVGPVSLPPIGTGTQQVPATLTTSITPRTQQSETVVNSFPGSTIQIPPGETGHVTNSTNVILEITYHYDNQTQANTQTPGETRLLQAIVGAQNNVIPPSIDETNATAQSVTRFAINSFSVSPGIPANPYTLAMNQLHHVEHFILQRALEKLLNPNDPKDVVIMDIFVTDRITGEIRFTSLNVNGQQTSVPEIHSVVLWKKNANNLNQIFLIDPNSVDFSKRLDSAYPNYDKGTNLAPSILTKPTIRGKVIYNGGDATIPRGYSDVDDPLPKARDCIDIAVKIAFEIQVQIAINTRAHDIEATVYAKITNQAQLNDALKPRKNPLNGTRLRAIQSSIPGLRMWTSIITIATVEQQLIPQLAQSSAVPTPSGTALASSSAPPAPQ